MVATYKPRVVFLELCKQRQQLLYAPLEREPSEEVTAARLMEEIGARGIVSGVNLALADYMSTLG